jgi:hypothetical protein
MVQNPLPEYVLSSPGYSYRDPRVGVPLFFTLPCNNIQEMLLG